MFKTVILAGERQGVSPFAATHGVPAKVLVPVAGRESLARVVDTLRASRSSDGGIICGPDRAIASVHQACLDIFSRGDFSWLQPAEGPASSALAAVDALADALNDAPEGAPAGVLLTSGDHAMLRPETVDAFCAAASRSPDDFVVGLAPYDVVAAAFPGSKRTVWRFSDEAFCSCNLFFLRNQQGRKVLSFWRSVESLRKQPWKIAGQLGWLTLARYFTGLLASAAAFETLTRRAGCRVGFVRIDDPRAAVDVDSAADWQLAESVLSSSDDDACSQQPA